MIDDTQIESLLSSYSIEGPSSAWIDHFKTDLAKKESSPGPLKAILIGLTTLALGLGGARYAYQTMKEPPLSQPISRPAKPMTGFGPEQFPSISQKIEVTPFSSYIGQSCKDIRNRRQLRLNENPVLKALLPKDFDSSKSRLMFSATDEKPWRRLDRTFFQDPALEGKNSSTAAIDSIVLENPFLLGHLSYSYYRLDLGRFVDDPKSFIEQCQQELTPTALTLEGKDRCFRVHYQLRKRRNYTTLATQLQANGGRAEYRLVLANAYDLGLDYCVVYSAESQGFDKSTGRFDNIRQTTMLCATGMEGLVKEEMTEIRYNGSKCPNLTLDSLPAKLSVGLWRDPPKDIKATPDVRLEIEITGSGEVSPTENYLDNK